MSLIVENILEFEISDSETLDTLINKLEYYRNTHGNLGTLFVRSEQNLTLKLCYNRQRNESEMEDYKQELKAIMYSSRSTSTHE